MFFRKYDALFKGISVPEWAHSQNREGHEIDWYARAIWDKAINESSSEQTPMPQKNERLGPNALWWMKLDHVNGGNSSRLFYNEEPKPTYFRYKGTFEKVDAERLFSFKDADQDFDIKRIFGADPDTPEGKKKMQDIIDVWSKAVPWLMNEEMKHYTIGLGNT